MRKVPKFFNTAGPIQPDIHYNIDPLTRINLEELESLIYQRKYSILHAPRQTGKTSCLLALRDYLNARGEFYVVYANVEAGQASRNQKDEVSRHVAYTIAERMTLVTGNKMPLDLYQEIVAATPPDSCITAYLRSLSETLDRPLLVFIDEINALVSVLRQISAGYDCTLWKSSLSVR